MKTQAWRVRWRTWRRGDVEWRDKTRKAARARAVLAFKTLDARAAGAGLSAAVDWTGRVYVADPLGNARRWRTRQACRAASGGGA